MNISFPFKTHYIVSSNIAKNEYHKLFQLFFISNMGPTILLM